jgi:hypothetical protein
VFTSRYELIMVQDNSGHLNRRPITAEAGDSPCEMIFKKKKKK